VIRGHQAAYAEAVAAKDALAMIATNRAFHAAIAEAGRNPYFTSLFLRLLDEGRRILRLYYQSFDDQLPQRIFDEHEAIIAAIEARDIDLCDRLGPRPCRSDRPPDPGPSLLREMRKTCRCRHFRLWGALYFSCRQIKCKMRIDHQRDSRPSASFRPTMPMTAEGVSDMNTEIFTGVIPALMTPCKADRQPDFDALVRKGQAS
jgi:hypothetical protein